MMDEGSRSLSGEDDLMNVYVERPPVPGLAGAVRTVWIQRTGESTYVQRHLPTGGVEIHLAIGGRPQLIGPLTGPQLEIIPARTTIVGVRFLPGTAPPLATALHELVDQHLDLTDLWGRAEDRLLEAIAITETPERALMALQAHLVQAYRRRVGGADPLVGEAVKALMPWHPVDVNTVATRLGLSASQLRRRCLHTVGLTPKVLQRTLRFQGFLALAQAGSMVTGQRDADGLAGMAIEAGYADQAHLNRECLRLTGLTPYQLLSGGINQCTCGHDHSASFTPFLANHSGPTRRA